MSNTIAVKIPLLLKNAMVAFKRNLLPISVFATNFSSTPLEFNGERKVKVNYYPLEGADSKDFNGEYEFDEGNVGERSVSIDKRKYQSLKKTSAEIADNKHVDWSLLFSQKAAKLAYDVSKSILGGISVANFGAAALDSTAANFDIEDIIDLKGVCNKANWPKFNRALLLGSDYSTQIAKSLVSNGGAATFAFNPLADTLPNICGFKFSEWDDFSATKVVGAAVYPSALLVGMSPITPPKESIEYYSYTDPDTGLTLEFREWFDPDTDSVKTVIECNYGFAVGEAAACKIITDGTGA